MHNHRKKLMLFLLVILISLLACQTTSTNENETINNVNSNTSENSITFQPAGPEELDLESPLLFMDTTESNYFLDFIYSFEGEDSNGNEVFGQMQLEGINAVTPEIASDYEMSIEGMATADGLAYIHFVDTPSRDYVFIPESGCISFGNDEFESPYGAFDDSDEMFIGTAQRVETAVMVNGVLTDRYELQSDNVIVDDFNSGETFELVNGSIWVAREGYLIKLEMEGTGTNGALTGDTELVGDIYYEFNFTPIDEPIQITPPEECETNEEGNPESSFPMTDDASNITSMGDDFISYNTSGSVQDIMSFYTQEMAANGYTLDSEVVVGTLITMRFIKGDEVVNIMGISDEGGGFYITIVKEN